MVDEFPVGNPDHQATRLTDLSPVNGHTAKAKSILPGPLFLFVCQMNSLELAKVVFFSITASKGWNIDFKKADDRIDRVWVTAEKRLVQWNQMFLEQPPQEPVAPICKRLSGLVGDAVSLPNLLP